jgi:hypothetical protein
VSDSKQRVHTNHYKEMSRSDSTGAISYVSDDMNPHEIHAESVTDSIERRGRSTTKKEMNFMRAPELVKNIQRVSSTSSPHTLHNAHLKGAYELLPRSRDASIHTMSSTNTTDENRRSSRFRHPMNAYNTNSTVETVVPNHTNILHQKFHSQRTHDEKKQIAHTNANQSKSSSLKRQSMSVSMDGDLVPAFDDLRMDFGEDESVKDGDYTSSDVDNRYGESLDSNNLDSSTSDTTGLEESLKKSLDESSGDVWSRQPVGRIQHRITALKTLKEHDDELSWRPDFSSIEQKTLLNYLNNELQSLRRSNHKPLIQSVQRVAKFGDDTTWKGYNSSDKFLIRTYHPLMNGEPHAAAKKTPDMDKLKDLLKKSGSVIDSLWVDEPSKSNKCQVVYHHCTTTSLKLS